MNKDQIQKFLNTACWDEQAQYELADWLDVEKFAELIVRECADIANNHFESKEPGYPGDKVEEHFGFEEGITSWREA